MKYWLPFLIHVKTFQGTQEYIGQVLLQLNTIIFSLHDLLEAEASRENVDSFLLMIKIPENLSGDGKQFHPQAMKRTGQLI